MEAELDQTTDDVQRRILQDTLNEVAARAEDSADCCVICLDVITEPCEALPCSHHNFDYICLSSWLFHTPQCPLCKSEVVKVQHGLAEAPITTFFRQKASASETRRNPTATRSNDRSYLGRRGGNRFRGQRGRRFHNEHIPTSVPDAVATRRDVYRHQRYSKHVGSNRLSRYRELTSNLFCTDMELVSRARMWIRRELRVFSFLTPDGDHSDNESTAQSTPAGSRTAVQTRRANNSEFLLEYIIAILKSVDIMGSGGQAEDMLSDFLGRENTKLFIHELRAWLRSPFTKLEDWDRAVQYEEDSARRASRGEVLRSETHGEDTSRRRWDDPNRYYDQKRGDFYRPGGQRDARNRQRDHGRRSRWSSRSPRRRA
ncbi:RING finger domain protein [Metarhizium rileyi]|uniref:RING-type E3 ubiquitin transferase n=1 Tax=Metarhizium rileyi (strain RCEF 4871) TaxID=1649241 RepID=A0A167JP60_METRR|nr:RING finger domain protein [Metarhizium rileyi RCEF 4871]